LARSARAWRGPTEEAGGSLFGIIQGGFDAELRGESARRTAEFDLPGYAIGGLSVGEPEPLMMDMLQASIEHLPEDRPRHAMGIGLPLNLIDMVMRGVDMFDCVVPTRNARNGRAYTFEGVVVLKHAAHIRDLNPLEADCPCATCRGYSRSYLRHLYLSNEILCSRLTSLHNLTFFKRLMDRIREAIPDGRLQQLRSELAPYYCGAAVGETDAGSSDEQLSPRS
jgi:queuine tRNA-ribosyltransferase